MTQTRYDEGENIPARNIISRWALIGHMSGDAFSTALRHASMMDMGEALEICDLQYDAAGAEVIETDSPLPCALLVSIERRQ